MGPSTGKFMYIFDGDIFFSKVAGNWDGIETLEIHV